MKTRQTFYPAILGHRRTEIRTGPLTTDVVSSQGVILYFVTEN